GRYAAARMSRKYWLGLFLSAFTAVLCATCAPVHRPAPKDGDGSPEPIGKPAPEPLSVVPRPHSAGPGGRIQAAIDHIRQRELLTTNGFWTVFHGILGLGPSVMLHNPETGEHCNALDYIAGGGELRGLQFIQTKHGLDVQMGPQFVGQGHQDQFAAEMA